MANTIELRILDSKQIIAEMSGMPLASENSYRIIAGEENATEFEIVQKPTAYENATYYVYFINSLGERAFLGDVIPDPLTNDGQEIVNDTFVLPKGMAVAGYGYIRIYCLYNDEKVEFQRIKVKIWETVPTYHNYVRPLETIASEEWVEELFAKKNGTYPNLNAGHASTADEAENAEYLLVDGTPRNGVYFQNLIDGKVQSNTTDTTSDGSVYVSKASGGVKNDMMIPIGNSSGNIVKRNTNGNVTTGTPQTAGEAANKAYVDNQLIGLEGVVVFKSQIGQANGVAPLDENGKLPVGLVPSIELKDYIQVSSEAELQTINAQIGDVAYLAETIDGKLTVTNSWWFVDIDTTQEPPFRIWAVLNTVYAENALLAQKANALMVSGNPKSGDTIQGEIDYISQGLQVVEQALSGKVNTSDVDSTQALTPNKVVQRNASGNVETGTATSDNEAVNKKFADDKLAYNDGSYDAMSVGNATYAQKAGVATNLDGSDKVEAEYTYRTSGGSADIGTGTATINSFKGRTRKWNQLMPLLASGNNYQQYNYSTIITFANGVATLTTANDGVGDICNVSNSVKHIVGHKYLLVFDYNPTSQYLYVANVVSSQVLDYLQSGLTLNAWNHYAKVFTATATSQMSIRLYSGGQIKNWQLFDLTDLDYASLTASEFKLLYPLDYYDYSLPRLLNNNAIGIETTKFNQFDLNAQRTETYGVATINGTQISITGTFYCSWKANLLPTTYYVRYTKVSGSYEGVRFTYQDGTLSSMYTNGATVTFSKPVKEIMLYCSGGTSGTTVYDNVCINISHSGRRNGEYQAFEKNTLSFDFTSIKDSNDNVVFPNGLAGTESSYDEVTENKAIKRRKTIDLSTLTFTYNSTYLCFISTETIADALGGSAELISTTKYTPTDAWITASDWTNGDKLISLYGNVRIKDTSISTSTTTFSGILEYPLATPTEVDIDWTSKMTYPVDDWGYEKALPVNTSTPTTTPIRYDVTYALNAGDYIRNAPQLPTTTGDYILHYNATNREATYEDVDTWLGNNGYNKMEDLLSTFGLKDALGGTLRQCLCVKESLDFDNTDVVDLGSLNWGYQGSGIFASNETISAVGVSGTNVAKALCTKYKNTQANWVVNGSVNKAITIYSNSKVYVCDTTYTSADTFKTAMKGVLLAYEKAST